MNVELRNFERIKARWGAGALALFSHGYGGNWMKHLFHAYGFPNIAAPSYAQCRGPRDGGSSLTCGGGVGSPEQTDIENSRCLVLIGSHMGENMHNTQVQEFAEAICQGASIIVVDPRFSVAAGKAKYYLPIRPGTDIALLLAWIHVLLNEGLYDKEYVAKHALGLEQLAAHVESFTPEWAYPETAIEPALIHQFLFSSIQPIEREDVTVLFADDSSVARNQIERTLEALGIKFIGAVNGRVAWDELQKIAGYAESAGRPVKDLVQLILTDVEMPEMDGYILTKNVKSDPRFAGIPVLMHSSLSSMSNQQLGKSVGVDEYVPKFEPQRLADTLRRLLLTPGQPVAAISE